MKLTLVPVATAINDDASSCKSEFLLVFLVSLVMSSTEMILYISCGNRSHRIILEKKVDLYSKLNDFKI